MRLTWADRLIIRLARLLQRIAPWHRLPRPLGLLCLMAIRTELRHQNLYDPAPEGTGTPPGAAGRHFGRNQPLWAAPRPTPASILEPNPREVSRRLLARTGPMLEVPFLNLLAAAWLQFMVHDWMSHGSGVPGEEIRVPLAGDDDWEARSPGDEMLIRRSRPSAAEAPAGGPPVFDNTETAWWDGSQMYGSSPEREALLRAGDGRAPDDRRRRPAAGGGAPRGRSDRGQRQLVGRPVGDAHALRPRAQRGVPHAGEGPSRLGRPAPVHHGPQDQRRRSWPRSTPSSGRRP